jgi:hypothetical protein
MPDSRDYPRVCLAKSSVSRDYPRVQEYNPSWEYFLLTL